MDLFLIPFTKTASVKLRHFMTVPLYLIIISFSTWHSFGETSGIPSISKGPWGTIEYYEVILEPPAQLLWPGLFAERSFWKFDNLSIEETGELFVSLDFSPELLEKIDTDAVFNEVEGGVEVDISNAIVEAMSAEERTRLTGWLRKNSREFTSATLINLQVVSDSELAAKVKPETYTMLKSLIFPRKNVISLIDRAYLMRKLGEDTEEKITTLQVLFSTRTLVARLVINEDDDLDAIAEYWSAEGKNPGVRSILDGVKSTPGVDRVDLVHLLPPLPRKYLYSFIKFDDANPVNAPDCFWMAQQFFKRSTTHRYLDPLSLDHYLAFDFEKIDGDPTFGDLIYLYDENTGDFVHAYIYVTEDLVFTKNGSSFARPLVLMHQDRMMYLYDEGYRLRSDVYRRKSGT